MSWKTLDEGKKVGCYHFPLFGREQNSLKGRKVGKYFLPKPTKYYLSKSERKLTGMTSTK